MRRVIFFDHLHAGPTILGDLIDVGAFHEAHADIGVPQAIGRAPLFIAIKLQIQFVENLIEKLAMVLWEEPVGQTGFDTTLS